METSFKDTECGQVIEQDSFLGQLGKGVSERENNYRENIRQYSTKARWRTRNRPRLLKEKKKWNRENKERLARATKAWELRNPRKRKAMNDARCRKGCYQTHCYYRVKVLGIASWWPRKEKS